MHDSNRVNRRRFLWTLAGGGALTAFLRTAVAAERTDEEIFRATVGAAIARGDAARPIGEIMAAIGRTFIGAPYVAHSLEDPGEEHLVVNLRAFDCTTFVESVLVLSRCVALGSRSFADYRTMLQRIRYRGGEMRGYPSRLHYFTDWVDDNVGKGIVRDVTSECGGETYRPAITFMSAHPSSYRQLADSTLLPSIREAERRLTARAGWYIPKERVDAAAGRFQTGDIIGITTSMEGLDVAHLGLAVRERGVVRLLHAPLSGGAVQLTATSLGTYLRRHAQHTGVIVARPREVRGA